MTESPVAIAPNFQVNAPIKGYNPVWAVAGRNATGASMVFRVGDRGFDQLAAETKLHCKRGHSEMLGETAYEVVADWRQVENLFMDTPSS